MQSSSKRTLLPGTEYDHLIPKPAGTETTVVKSGATVEQTVDLMREKVHRTLYQTEKLAKKLMVKGDLRQSCRNVWNFVYKHIQYKPDTFGIEEVRSPRRLWADRVTGGDCDCMTVFISSLLTNMGIPHQIRVMAQPGVAHYHHVYVVVPKNMNAFEQLSGYHEDGDYIVIDCVMDRYDTEPEVGMKKDFPTAAATGMGNLVYIVNEEKAPLPVTNEPPTPAPAPESPEAPQQDTKDCACKEPDKVSEAPKPGKNRFWSGVIVGTVGTLVIKGITSSNNK